MTFVCWLVPIGQDRWQLLVFAILAILTSHTFLQGPNMAGIFGKDEPTTRTEDGIETPWNGRMTGFLLFCLSLSRLGDRGLAQKNTRRRHVRTGPRLSRRLRFSAKPVSLPRHQFSRSPRTVCPYLGRSPPSRDKDTRNSPQNSSFLATPLKRAARALHSLRA